MPRPISSCCLLTLAALAAAATDGTAQRDPVQLTTSTEAHQDARISPTGIDVAFRGSGKLGVVPFAGGSETPLVQSANLGDFLWSPRSTGLYFIDGTDLKFVSRSGGAPAKLATLPGLRHRLWSVDNVDRKIWGTRFNSTTQIYSIFTVGTNGSGFADILSTSYALDEVRLDPSEQWIAYLQYVAGQPFAKRDIYRAGADGSNPTPMTLSPLDGDPQNLLWADAGQTAVFSLISQTTFKPQLARIDTAGTLEMLTEGAEFRRYSTVSRDRQWITVQAQYAAGLGVAVLPATGGGLVLLTDDGVAYSLQGSPTLDASAAHVAFAAAVGGAPAQVFGVSLDRELRIHPRVEINSSFTVDMPIRGNELGGVFLGVLGTGMPLQLPGVVGSFALDPSVFVTLASGATGSGMLSATVPVPNNPWLIGQALAVQGVRLDAGGLGGDFSRHAQLRIF